MNKGQKGDSGHKWDRGNRGKGDKRGDMGQRGTMETGGTRDTVEWDTGVQGKEDKWKKVSFQMEDHLLINYCGNPIFEYYSNFPTNSIPFFKIFVDSIELFDFLFPSNTSNLRLVVSR